MMFLLLMASNQLIQIVNRPLLVLEKSKTFSEILPEEEEIILQQSAKNNRGSGK
jgi:hypothetical protein